MTYILPTSGKNQGASEQLWALVTKTASQQFLRKTEFAVSATKERAVKHLGRSEAETTPDPESSDRLVCWWSTLHCSADVVDAASADRAVAACPSAFDVSLPTPTSDVASEISHRSDSES